MYKSLLDGNKKGRCFLCGKYAPTEKHHIFYGTANRRKSELLGLHVYLCHYCHNEPPNGVHFNKARDTELKKRGQQAYENAYIQWNDCTAEEARAAFMRVFGKNYIY